MGGTRPPKLKEKGKVGIFKSSVLGIHLLKTYKNIRIQPKFQCGSGSGVTKLMNFKKKKRLFIFLLLNDDADSLFYR